ncbi:MAG: hypothetical protein MJK18_00435 [Bdellovibrionales bacterium]|nr:hypothetical protein [Bdellovibrionales bacterium]
MKKLKNQKGQMTIEAVLIATLLLSTLTVASRIIKDQGYLSSLVEGPWQHLSGMIQNGVWAPPQQGTALHPNNLDRHGSPVGDGT